MPQHQQEKKGTPYDFHILFAAYLFLFMWGFLHRGVSTQLMPWDVDLNTQMTYQFPYPLSSL